MLFEIKSFTIYLDLHQTRGLLLNEQFAKKNTRVEVEFAIRTLRYNLETKYNIFFPVFYRHPKFWINFFICYGKFSKKKFFINHNPLSSLMILILDSAKFILQLRTMTSYLEIFRIHPNSQAYRLFPLTDESYQLLYSLS